MEDQKKKDRDWSALLIAGKPANKHRLELKKIKESLEELEVDIDGFTFDTESDFRDFVLAKNTPGDDIEEFLKKSLTEANIEFNDKAFRRLDKSGYLDLFFDVFTLGLEEDNSSNQVDPSTNSSNDVQNSDQIEAQNPAQNEDQIENQDVSKDQVAPFDMEEMDYIYKTGNKTGNKAVINSISYMDFTITDQIPVRAQDNFALRFRRGAPEITYDRVALFNTSLQKTVAVGHLEESGNSPKIVFSAADIDYKSIQKNRNHEIILFPKDKTDKKFYAIECKLGFQDLEEAKRTLCIDFGTSNTTAGSYGILDEQANQPEIVKFPDVTDPNNTTRQMIPTLVYIDSCEDGKEIRYAFGYDAKKRIIDDHFESKATVFHEIKSWINDLDKEEEIFDSQGNNARVRREDVIKAYLSHVIALSEQYFHKRFRYLHFSAPVKLKTSFLNKMQEMFPKPNYIVQRAELSLDEGIAIVYNHIAKRIKNIQSGQSETVFVIDCGGGTTDLAKCEYSYTTASMGDGKKILSIKNKF